MTPEQFINATGQSISIGRAKDNTGIDPAGGYRAAADHCVGFGDTVDDAIQACFDHVLRRPARRSRVTPPFFPSERLAKNWSKCLRVDYDYRSRDFEPPPDDEPRAAPAYGPGSITDPSRYHGDGCAFLRNHDRACDCHLSKP